MQDFTDLTQTCHKPTLSASKCQGNTWTSSIRTSRAEMHSPGELITLVVWGGVWQFVDSNVYTRNATGFAVAAHLSTHKPCWALITTTQSLLQARVSFIQARCFGNSFSFEYLFLGVCQSQHSVASMDMTFCSERVDLFGVCSFFELSGR